MEHSQRLRTCIDPWLPATYVGIYMLLLGAILMFITAGRNKYKKEEEKK